MFFLPKDNLRVLFLKSSKFKFFFSSTITLSLILKPLFAIALLASLFDDVIFLLDKKF